MADTLLLGIVAYFLRQRLADIQELQKTVQALKTKIAVLIDRDRRKRLEDYLQENGVDKDDE